MFSFFNTKKPVKDAKKIHDSVNYEILRAVWDGYVRIKKTGFQQTHRTATPAWFALFAIQNYEGKFQEFDVDELHLIKAFTTVPESYAEIMTELKQHANDQHLAEYIIATHPNLDTIVPEEFNNTENLNKYLLSEIGKYKSMLEDYYQSYKDEIDSTIARLENRLRLQGEIKEKTSEELAIEESQIQESQTEES